MSIGLEAIKSLVRKLTAHYFYNGLFPSTVMAQAADGTVDVLPDDKKIRGAGGLQGVKIRHGLPGFTVEVYDGSRVLLGFEGVTKTPYVSLWEAGSVKKIRLNNGELPIATLGALVTSGGPGLIVTLVPVSPAPPTGAPPNGAVVVGAPHFLSFSPIAPLDFLTGSDCEPLYGSVSDGIQEFLG